MAGAEAGVRLGLGLAWWEHGLGAGSSYWGWGMGCMAGAGVRLGLGLRLGLGGSRGLEHWLMARAGAVY